MATELVTMSTRELDRLEIVRRVQERSLTQAKAGQLLGLSARQVRRMGARTIPPSPETRSMFPLKFLSPDLIKPRLRERSHFRLWEGRIVADGAAATRRATHSQYGSCREVIRCSGFTLSDKQGRKGRSPCF